MATPERRAAPPAKITNPQAIRIERRQNGCMERFLVVIIGLANAFLVYISEHAICPVRSCDCPKSRRRKTGRSRFPRQCAAAGHSLFHLEAGSGRPGPARRLRHLRASRVVAEELVQRKSYSGDDAGDL